MKQFAKMTVLAQDEDGTEGRMACPCGGVFEFSVFTEENMDKDDDGELRIHCPVCGCFAAKESTSPVENPLEEELRRSIGARGREKLEATKRLLRRQ